MRQVVNCLFINAANFGVVWNMCIMLSLAFFPADFGVLLGGRWMSIKYGVLRGPCQAGSQLLRITCGLPDCCGRCES